MTNLNSYYWLGGVIKPDIEEARRTYVERGIDNDLYVFLKDNPKQKRLCSIFSARQMGKTSLIRKLKSEIDGQKLAICTQVDFQSTVKLTSEIELYKKLTDSICDEIKNHLNYDFKNDINLILKRKNDESLGDKFRDCLQFMLNQIENKKIIVFFDEIDLLYEWKLLDYLLYPLRGIEQDEKGISWNNINFVLVGSINPNVLLDSPSFSFNDCQDFEIPNLSGECKPLWGGLKDVTRYPDKVIQSILRWTGGKPFLTQYLCSLFERDGHLLNLNDKKYISENAENFIKNQAINELINEDPAGHLHEIDKRLTYLDSEQNLSKIKYLKEALTKYIKILNLDDSSNNPDEPIYFDHSYAHKQLLTSGIAIKVGGLIKVACLIYKKRFNINWANQRLKDLTQQMEENMSEKIDRDYVLIIDRSPSMNSSEPDGMTRWETIHEVTRDFFFHEMNKRDPDGVTVYLFSDDFERFDKVAHDDIDNFFEENLPRGYGTKLGSVLKETLDDYFVRKANEQIKKGGEWIIVITDGKPAPKQAVIDEIVKATHKIEDRSELAITFIRVGEELNAINFLKELDDDLKKHGAKHDICDYKSIYELGKINFNKLEYDAFND